LFAVTWNDDESAGPVRMLELIVLGAASVVPAVSLKARNDLAGISFDDGQSGSQCAQIYTQTCRKVKGLRTGLRTVFATIATSVPRRFISVLSTRMPPALRCVRSSPMVKIVPVDRQRHAGKGWRRPSGCLFAATDALASLVGSEFTRAAGTLPIAFIEQSGRYQPVAIMSPVPGRNLFVAPTGQWLGTYMPTGLRSYPFRLPRVEGSDNMTLCVDEDSGLIVDADDTTEKFFEADGSPSAALKAMLELLQQVERNRSLTDLAVAALAQAGLIAPWPLTVRIGDQQVAANGLHRIDDAKLNVLDEATFLKLRKSSSLILAYAQLISMHSIVTFGHLAAIQQQLAQRAQPLPSVSSLFTPDDGGTIRFN
jgi:hypothetical protein